MTDNRDLDTSDLAAATAPGIVSVQSPSFIEYPLPDLPGISLARVGTNGFYNYYFAGSFAGDLFDVPPGYLFADATVFPEFNRYQGAPVQVIGARVPVRGHDIEPMVFEIDNDGFRSSLLWGGYVTLRHHDAIAGTQFLVLVD